MTGGLASLREWPIAAWVILAATAIFVAEYLWLRVREARSRPPARRAEQRLSRFATALRNYGTDHDHRLPSRIEELGLPESDAVTYRPVPKLDLDAKLILIHDAAPTHRVLEFPALRDGRGVVFCNGRLRVLSEEAWDKLRTADDALRQKLELEPIAPASPRTGDRDEGAA